MVVIRTGRKGENMPEEYKMAYKGGTGEIVEKKSRFIADVLPVTSEEEAQAFIADIKKKYWDARHHCFAYVIGDRHELARFSDDGEPGGTAGKPMLDVLLGEDIHNVAVVVTRYFGGTLLGTGGLVRAYSGAAKAGLANAQIISRIQGTKLLIDTEYGDLGKIQYILGERKITILDSVYTDKVQLVCVIPVDELVKVQEEITEGTGARAFMEEVGDCYYAEIDGQVKILEE